VVRERLDKHDGIFLILKYWLKFASNLVYVVSFHTLMSCCVSNKILSLLHICASSKLNIWIWIWICIFQRGENICPSVCNCTAESMSEVDFTCSYDALMYSKLQEICANLGRDALSNQLCFPYTFNRPRTCNSLWKLCWTIQRRGVHLFYFVLVHMAKAHTGPGRRNWLICICSECTT
jgi:hypothetical protein